jgi:transcriptional regulator with PAS, ATPase and Fis domain/HAMP domain-containing protein
MGPHTTAVEPSIWARRASVKIPIVGRLNIGPRLTLCFVFIILLMLGGNGLLLWQFHLVRLQEERLTGVGQELNAVLRFQSDLLSFHAKLDELAESQDVDRLKKEAGPLRAVLLEDTERTRNSLTHLPAETHLDPSFLPTLEAIESALPSQLEAITGLATSGDWQAVRLRLANEKKPLEAQTSALVKNIEQEVTEQQAEAVMQVARLQNRILMIVPLATVFTLLIAAFLGLAITRSITDPLKLLMEGSKAIARGEFQHQVSVMGQDELAQLGQVFNNSAGRLRSLYGTLQKSEANLAEAQRMARCGSWSWDVRTGDIFWSQEFFRIYECDPEKIKPSWSYILERVYAEDRPGIEQRAKMESTQKDMLDSEGNFRIVFSDGRIKHLRSIAHPVMNELGEITEVVGTTMDVTEQYEARAALEIAFEQIKELKDQLYKENIALREEIDKVSMFEEIVGSSEPLRRVLSQVAKVAATDSTVLILGETGTGKELIARAIHRRSKRANRAFIRVNCAAIPPALIASELFGHEKGAFTGATQRRLGRFELADAGTIFLDEIGELPAETQSALLRVLQEREFDRVGGSQSVSVDVRILSATNRDLKAAVQAGTFRQDLFYRLNVFPIQMPSLRERADDIPLLVEYLIERYAKKAGKKFRNIDKKTLALFQDYNWPGNIRELQNVVERAVILCDTETFSVDQTWLQRELPPEPTPRLSTSPRGLGRLDETEERGIIEAALTETGGRVSGPSGAAALLGVPRQTLESKIASLGINKHRFKSV